MTYIHSIYGCMSLGVYGSGSDIGYRYMNSHFLPSIIVNHMERQYIKHQISWTSDKFATVSDNCSVSATPPRCGYSSNLTFQSADCIECTYQPQLNVITQSFTVGRGNCSYHDLNSDDNLNSVYHHNIFRNLNSNVNHNVHNFSNNNDIQISRAP